MDAELCDGPYQQHIKDMFTFCAECCKWLLLTASGHVMFAPWILHKVKRSMPFKAVIACYHKNGSCECTMTMKTDPHL